MHRVINISITAIAIVCLLASQSFPQSQSPRSEPFAWKLKPGQRFRVTVEQSTDTNTVIGTRKTSINSETELVIDWNVTNVSADGDATIEQALVSIKLSVGDPAVPSQAVGYDTSSDAEVSRVSEKLLEQVRPLVGLKWELVMSKRGEIKEMIVPDATTVVVTKLPESVKFRSIFTPAGQREILGPATVVFPDDPVVVGGSWSDTSDLKPVETPFGKFKRNRTYTFAKQRSIDGRQFAEFSIKSTMEPVGEATVEERQAKLKPALLDFSGTGTLTFDTEAGFFSGSEFENQAHTIKPYREKKIDTTVVSRSNIRIEKK